MTHKLENLKKKLEQHYLSELELIVEIFKLDQEDAGKLRKWIEKECQSFIKLKEVLDYARG